MLFFFAFSGAWVTTAKLASFETRCSLWLEWNADHTAIIPHCIGSCEDAPTQGECELNEIMNIHYCICYGLSEPPWCRGKFHPKNGVDCLPADNCPYTCKENLWQDFAAWQACSCS
ncbi:MAG: hypothetical protein R3B13_41555, partial [Polyangiaceae bacterium]